MTSIKTLIDKRIVALSIVMFPFYGAFEKMWLPAVGFDGAAYPLFVGVGLSLLALIIGTERIMLPVNKSMYALFAMLIIMVISCIINVNEILGNTTMGHSGVAQVLVNIFQFCFYMIASIYVFKVLVNNEEEPVEFFNRYIVISFILAGGYSIIEIMGSFLEISFFKELLTTIDSLFRSDFNYDFGGYGKKIRSLAMESSYFGSYSSILYPFLLTGCFTYKNKKVLYIILLIFFFVLNYLSFSRTSYVILIVETVTYFLMIKKYKLITKHMMKKMLYSIALVVAVVIGISAATTNRIENEGGLDEILVSVVDINDTERLNSNLTRYGSKLAAVDIFFDNPIIGVGAGQYGFYAPNYYPSWAWLAADIRLVVSDKERFPVTYDLYLKILSEQGILGLIVLIMFFYYAYRLSLADMTKKTNKEKMLSISMAIAMLGMILSGFNSDLYDADLAVLIGVIWAQYQWHREDEYHE